MNKFQVVKKLFLKKWIKYQVVKNSFKKINKYQVVKKIGFKKWIIYQVVKKSFLKKWVNIKLLNYQVVKKKAYTRIIFCLTWFKWEVKRDERSFFAREKAMMN